MAHIDFIQPVHHLTQRDYLMRVFAGNKAEFATVAKRFDFDYWDGSRNTGYGGYRYDGRWRPVAERLAVYYELKPGSHVLDIGCGKGYLIKELIDLVPGIVVAGTDVSTYAIENAHPDVAPFLNVADAQTQPFDDKSFDLILSINVLHNLRLPQFENAIREIERLGRGGKYIVMDSYRNEQEKVNLLYWQLTCECFFTPDEWGWIFSKVGYNGDFSFVYFE